MVDTEAFKKIIGSIANGDESIKISDISYFDLARVISKHRKWQDIVWEIGCHHLAKSSFDSAEFSQANMKVSFKKIG
jgi:hypothetical protein